MIIINNQIFHAGINTQLGNKGKKAKKPHSVKPAWNHILLNFGLQGSFEKELFKHD
jgi:hypothetical protein